MNKYFQALGALSLALCMAGCQTHTRSGAPEDGSDSLAVVATDTITLRYAQAFTVTPFENGHLVTIQDPQSSHAHAYRFALLPKEADDSRVPEGYTVIRTPIQSVVCMTSLQLSNFIRLGELERVVGITSTRHLFNEQMKRQLKEGKTHKIGIEGNFDGEIIMALNPDVILISPFKRGGYDVLKEVSIPLIPHLGYKENTPLGQAEWLKFVGLLTGEERKANEIFNAIEQRYNELKALTAKVEKRPVVFSGELHNGNWYAVGGQSFLAQLFRDAGADYFLKDNPSSGGVTLDFETVYSQADNADFWRLLNSYDGEYTYEAVKQADPRYVDFKAFKEKHILYCNQGQQPYYENMPTEPEILLADFVKAFHPELLPDYQPKYYRLLTK
jgi:iron complex transport system substrate-binding protein